MYIDITKQIRLIFSNASVLLDVNSLMAYFYHKKQKCLQIVHDTRYLDLV
jgi:hypothetical protein